MADAGSVGFRSRKHRENSTFFWLLCLILVIGLSSIASAWQIETLEQSTDYRFTYSGTSIAVDSSGTPSIAYDTYSDGKVKLGIRNVDGSSWQISTLTEPLGSAPQPAIAIDSQNRPHIVAFDPNNQAMDYITMVPAVQRQRIDGASYPGYFVTPHSIAVDSQNRPHVAYAGYQNFTLKYAVYNTTIQSWKTENVDTNVGLGVSISVDSHDRPHIVYTNKDLTKVLYAYYNGQEWVKETLFAGTSAYAVGRYCALDLDASDHPHIVYSKANALIYTMYDGTRWNVKSDFSNRNAYWVAIGVDQYGHPNIVYTDPSSTGTMKYAGFNGTQWIQQIVDSGGDTGRSPAIAVDKTGRVHISYISDSSPYRVLYATHIPMRPNISPVADAGTDRSSTIGERVEINGSMSSDPDGNLPLSYAWQFIAKPAGSQVTLSSGTAMNPTFIPDIAGAYILQLIVRDSLGAVSPGDTVTINVADVNHPPVIAPIGLKSVDAGNPIIFNVSVSDPDNDPVTITYTDLPQGALFNLATKTFVWTPEFSQAGSYSVNFTASDGSLTDTETAMITVNPVNRPPVFVSVPLQTVDAGKLLSFAVVASDPDNDSVTITCTDLPQGATFNLATKTFEWTPEFSQAGSYSVKFTASDGSLTDTETAMITVNHINRPPVFVPVPPQTTDEGKGLSFTLSASDPDNDPVIITCTDLPLGAAFNPVTKTFDWTPEFSQAGSYPVKFMVSDGSLTDTETITITVNNVNRNPVAEAGTAGTVMVKEPVTLDGSQSMDPEGTIASYTWNYGDGTSGYGVTQTHSYTGAGTYVVTLTVTDSEGGTGTDSTVVTVISSNQMIQDVITLIKTMNLPKGTETSLVSKLNNAVKSLDKNNPDPAKNQIQAAIDEINAQKGKKITLGQADTLNSRLQKIIPYL